LCGPAEAALFVALLQLGHDEVRCEALWCLANIAAGGSEDTVGVRKAQRFFLFFCMAG
jgi:hypothetical protein